MATSIDEYEKWLSKKLVELNPEVDLDVFVPYIRSILESETDEEDLCESLSGIIEEINESGVLDNCTLIIGKWKEYAGDAGTKQDAGKPSLDEQLSSIMSQQQQQATKVAKPLTAEDRARQEAKAAILNQYAEVSDGEVTDSDEETADLATNVNAKLVVDREKAQRDKSKHDADAKKQRDKEEREKQKQKAEDRKESEKKRTQKGERRR